MKENRYSEIADKLSVDPGLGNILWYLSKVFPQQWERGSLSFSEIALGIQEGRLLIPYSEERVNYEKL